MATLLGALLRNESGGRNIPNVHQGTTSGQAQGYFQITTGTWKEFAQRAGIDLNRYPTPMSAADGTPVPYAVQAQVASIIPLSRWDKTTIAAMNATGRPVDPRRTLGENLAASGEDFGGGPQMKDVQNKAPASGAATTQSQSAGTAPAIYGQQPVVHAPSVGSPEEASAHSTAPLVTTAPKPEYPMISPETPKQGPVTPPGMGPGAYPPQPMLADKDPYTGLDKHGWRNALAHLAGGYKMPDMAKNDTNLASLAMPPAARIDTPEIPTFDPNQINMQRQNLAMAMQRLNTGRIWG